MKVLYNPASQEQVGRLQRSFKTLWREREFQACRFHEMVFMPTRMKCMAMGGSLLQVELAGSHWIEVLQDCADWKSLREALSSSRRPKTIYEKLEVHGFEEKARSFTPFNGSIIDMATR